MHIEAIASLTAIAGASAAALACDILRARNAQLRELVIRMKAQKTGPGVSKPTSPRQSRLQAAETRGIAGSAMEVNPAENGKRRERPAMLEQPPKHAKATAELNSRMIERAMLRAAQKIETERDPAQPQAAGLASLPAASPVANAQLWATLFLGKSVSNEPARSEVIQQNANPA